MLVSYKQTASPPTKYEHQSLGPSLTLTHVSERVRPPPETKANYFLAANNNSWKVVCFETR